mmetsp:Transcript_11110/g.34062  ORF Transcript_11110/g.34062 Transcript_11110/m.34062 type:complete len:286 (+) Transcript_11110:433-1290(+)|eukprot:CAMPEP_0198724780 /NCGR_PEP_ID=MMETSP1475-20131203/2201_1 /TAXON_ID= ORGANISM="Unidentified sp., Strain CCMP1999" /NCGR_SAMPLE_ID=MMETSP1475 /ASSEMBLY_ACC=CAM_ASM_001111 /LENGTH=285 /DNA_ID=CAMNT_0044486401 /DNA_START=409 /DNA_END=1266 /DNA_ORIENTATION=-
MSVREVGSVGERSVIPEHGIDTRMRAGPVLPDVSTLLPLRGGVDGKASRGNGAAVKPSPVFSNNAEQLPPLVALTKAAEVAEGDRRTEQAARQLPNLCSALDLSSSERAAAGFTSESVTPMYSSLDKPILPDWRTVRAANPMATDERTKLDLLASYQQDNRRLTAELEETTKERNALRQTIDELERDRERQSSKTPKRYWGADEHQRFLEGLQRYGKDMNAVARHVGTRSATQVRTHAQKHFLRMAKLRKGHKMRSMSETDLVGLAIHEALDKSEQSRKQGFKIS